MSESRWTVIGAPETTPNANGKGSVRKALARCTCGTERLVNLRDVRIGRSKSCGCLNIELARERATKHGDVRTRLHNIWSQMRARCTSPKHIGWDAYGGRGIRVDERWDDYRVFKKWALDNGYSDDLEIDRVDTNGPYAPENCRWVTRSENMRNTRASRMLTAFGETKSMADWAEDERCVCTYYTLRTRLHREWDVEAALTTPTRGSGTDNRNRGHHILEEF